MRDGQVVGRELDGCAEVVRLAEGVGDGLDDVDVEVVDHGQVGVDEDAVVVVVGGEGLADVVGGELHEDVEVGRPVDGFALEAGGVALHGIHGCGLLRVIVRKRSMMS